MDQTAYSTVQAMDPFIKRFGSYNPKTHKHFFTATQLSLLNSLPRITFAAGILLGGVLGERFGRRPIIFLMLTICLIGVTISYCAQNYAQVLVGRMLVQGYIGMEGYLVPMFQAEIAPAAVRGVVVISYLFNHVFGSFIMSCITYRTSQLQNDYCWKIPIAVMFVIPAFVILCGWILPESPRWLLRRGRDEEALKQLRYLYGSNPLYTPEVELALMKETLSMEVEKGSWLDLVRRTNLRRTGIVVIIQCLNQLTGQAFATQYGTVFIKTLGTINPYKFTLISNAIGVLGPFLTFFLVDRIGRRRMYLIFGSFCCAALITMGGLGLGTVTFQQKAGIVSMTILYPFFYCFSFGGMAPLTGAEVPALRLRDKSAVIGWTFQNLAAFVVTFTVPYLIDASYANLQSKLGFIYGAIGVLGLIWAYFSFPELMGRSLEEIDEMFVAKLPARKFRNYKPFIESAGNKVMEEHSANAGDSGIADLEGEMGKSSTVHVENTKNYS
ncbi:Major facilitator superfamily domain, general substrate transporter [Penicillium occitanis (nom. inval.)]|nr:Major facilitator superfamily domain, general substrate transporter [Penicillium occitanis (nom. inval.)]PCH01436.1 hypothetical protein PENOC_048350 [Penicillium occitanis (nom. inval.)]